MTYKICQSSLTPANGRLDYMTYKICQSSLTPANSRLDYITYKICDFAFDDARVLPEIEQIM
jgi:hypothetical protein